MTERAVQCLQAAVITGAAAILATFFYEPTLKVYFGWADYILK